MHNAVILPLSHPKQIQMSSKEEAELALKSPVPVCNNRFIKVYWARHDPKDEVTLTSAAEFLEKEQERNTYRSADAEDAESKSSSTNIDPEAVKVCMDILLFLN